MSASVESQGAIDPLRFRQLLGCFPTGVAIITTCTAAGEPVGLTCNSFSSVSLEPPLVLFSLRKASRLVDVFATAPGFAINILSQSQDALSGRFASSKIADKFEGVAWHAGVSGWPVIDQCLASFECSRHALHDGGDHIILVGRVMKAMFEPRRDPLLYFRGKYRRLHFT